MLVWLLCYGWSAEQTRLESSGVILAAQMCDGAKERCWLLSAEVHSRCCRTLSTNEEYDWLDEGGVAFAPDGPGGAVWASYSASRTKLTCRSISAWRWSCLLRTRCRSFSKAILSSAFAKDFSPSAGRPWFGICPTLLRIRRYAW